VISTLFALLYGRGAPRSGAITYPTPFDKAAALAESIIRRHPFIEGNKRTATFAAAYLLETSGHELEVEQQDLEEDLAVGVAEGGMDTTDIARWFEYHSRRT
jgi:death on curing protein